MIKAVIIDDEVKCIEVLELMLHNYVSGISVVGRAANAADGANIIRALAPDLVFLDVQMPGGDGFTLVQQFPDINFRIIFTTAYDQYAIQAIKCNALDYLLKPIDINELKEAVNRYRETKPSTYKTLINGFKEGLAKKKLFEKVAIPTISEILFVDTGSIVYMKSDNNYTQIFLDDRKSIVSSRNIGYYEELLESSHFFRIHNTYIVNLKKIARYLKGKSGYVVLEDETRLEVSARRKEELIQLLGI